MATKRILLAEDHAIVRAGIRSLLDPVPELEVVAEAKDGLEAVELAKKFQPDLILMDISMPLMNGTEAIKRIKLRQPEIWVIVMTLHKSGEHVRSVLDAGAEGYLLKDDTHQELLAAIRSVTAGGTYLSPKICGEVVGGYLGRTLRQGGAAPWDTLTDRERGVLKLVAEGFKNREIAERLCVSVKTVEKHRANVMKKLDLHNAAGLTAYAINNGLVVR